MLMYVNLSKPTFRFLYEEAFKMLLYRKPIWSKFILSLMTVYNYRGIQVLHYVTFAVEVRLCYECVLHDDRILLHAL